MCFGLGERTEGPEPLGGVDRLGAVDFHAQVVPRGVLPGLTRDQHELERWFDEGEAGHRLAGSRPKSVE
ncbi:hypothetical protein [Saccharopolyspora rhizosphaerae]|uniref:hypothetical protein n=1 Tax=Saccharopolyspora rhizosphaerae TaxID=2492662 RepID=UPI0013154F7E|nr:hypothetical protein [Saccharopolyspora rhizosphaerae]